MMKYIYAVLGGGVVIFMFTLFFPVIQAAQNATTAELAPSVGNFDGLANTMEASPLLIWFGLFAIPVVIIAVYLWQRRQRAGG